jgi:uncharacterized membrane protein
MRRTVLLSGGVSNLVQTMPAEMRPALFPSGLVTTATALSESSRDIFTALDKIAGLSGPCFAQQGCSSQGTVFDPSIAVEGGVTARRCARQQL